MANRDRRDNAIRHAIDAQFSGVVVNPRLRRRVLREVRRKGIVKKKLSLGLVLMIILVLITVSALATMTLSALFEKAIEVESQSGFIQDWSTEDKVALVEWMKAVGVEQDDERIAKLNDENLPEEQRDNLAMEIIAEYFPSREEKLTTMDIVAKEYGPYEDWSIELKAWYTSTLEKYHHDEKNGVSARNVLPNEDEFSEEEAKSFAHDCLTEIVGIDEPYISTLRLAIYFQESIEDVPNPSRTWYLNYFDPDTGELLYFVYMSSYGELIDCGGPEEYNTVGEQLEKEFRDLISNDGDCTFFTVEGFAAFGQDLAPRINDAILKGEEISKWPTYFSKIPYAYPSETSISEEEALRIGTEAILKYCGWDAQELNDYYKLSLSYRIYDPASPEWRLSYRLPAGAKDEALEKFHAGEIPFCLIVRMHSESGEVIEVCESYDSHTNWYGE